MADNMLRRERQKQETRAKIVEAATQLLLEEGTHGFSMRKLAARIGYSATAIYFHFPDKEALLGEIVDRRFMAFRKAFERIGRENDPMLRLMKMGIAFVEFAMEHPDSYRFMFMNTSLKVLPKAGLIERGNPAQDCYAYLRATVEEGIVAGRFRKEFDDSDELAQLFFSGVHGLVALHIARGEDPWVDWRPIRPTARKMVESLIRGLSRDGETLTVPTGTVFSQAATVEGEPETNHA